VNRLDVGEEIVRTEDGGYQPRVYVAAEDTFVDYGEPEATYERALTRLVEGRRGR